MNFKYGYAKCGIKKSKKLDLAIIYSGLPCNYAGVFTTNQVRAACVDENKALLKKQGSVKAVVINSGNANACTGKQGIQAAKKTKKITAKKLGIKESEVLIASTGGIGVQLDMNKLEAGIEKASENLSEKNFKKACEAIITTDKFIKESRKKGKGFYIHAMAKGAGMIHPNMATMLSYVMTDLKMPRRLLQKALQSAVDKTFNMISVEGDTSTNDMVVLLSDNSSKRVVKKESDTLYKEFVSLLTSMCEKLAKDIVRDGEGATKIIEIEVLNAKNKKDAVTISRAVSTSTIFQCAIFGADPNWGRVLARIGATGIKVNQNKVLLKIFKTKVFEDGEPLKFDRNKLSKELKKQKEVKVSIDLKQGKHEATAFASDITYDYVRENSEYFS